MSDNVDNKLDLSPSGRIRHEDILKHVLQRSRARRNRRRRSAAAIVASGLALGIMVWTQFGGENLVVSHAPPSQPIHDNEATPTLPLAMLYPNLDVEIVSGGEPDKSQHAIALERISDEQLISQLVDAQLPFGLLFADGRVRLLPHAPSHEVQR